MLVLADADGFRIDFHQFRKRVLQTARNRHRAADCHVKIRQLRRRKGRCGINRGARLRNHHLGERHLGRTLDEFTCKLVRLARGCAIADGDQLDLVLAAEIGKRGERFRPTLLRLVRIDCRIFHDLAGRIDHGRLHAGAEARIEPESRARAGRCRQQQVTQVSGEDLDAFHFRDLPEPDAQIDREGRFHARAPGPAHAIVQPFVAGASLRRNSKLRGDAIFIQRRHTRLRWLDFRIELEIEHLFLLAPEHRKDTMRGQLGERLAEVEIIGEFCALGFLAGAHGRAQAPLCPECLP